MASIVKYGRRWSNEGKPGSIVYDLNRSFLSVHGQDVYETSTGLVAWWRLQYSSGLLRRTDLSGNGNYLSNPAGPSHSSSEYPSTYISPKGLSLFGADGDNDQLYVPYPRLDSLTFGKPYMYGWDANAGKKVSKHETPFCIAFWVKFSSTGSREYIVTKAGIDSTGYANEWVVFKNADDEIDFRIYSGGSTGGLDDRAQGIKTNDTINAGVWVHIAVTYDGRGGNGTGAGNPVTGGMEIYINGAQAVTTISVADTYHRITDTSASVTLGNVSLGNSDYNLNAYLGDVAIWRRLLAAKEISAIYNAHVSGVAWQIRDFREKGSGMALSHSGLDLKLNPEDYFQGVSIKTMNVLHQSILPRIKSNAEPIVTLGGNVVEQRWFNDNRSPINYGIISGSLGVTHGDGKLIKEEPPGTFDTIVDTGAKTWPNPLNADESTAFLESSMGDSKHMNIRHQVSNFHIQRSKARLDTGQGLTQELIPNNVMERRDLGMPDLSDNNTPYVDLDRFSPLLVIESDPWDLELPAELLGANYVVFDVSPPGGVELSYITANSLENAPLSDPVGASYTGISLMDGVLEPFPLRSVIDRSNLDIPFVARGTRASVGPGQDTFRKNYFIEVGQQPTYAENTEEPPWLDHLPLFGADSLRVGVTDSDGTVHSSYIKNTITVMGAVLADDSKIVPFKDSTDVKERTSQITDDEIAGVLSNVDLIYTTNGFERWLDESTLDNTIAGVPLHPPSSALSMHTSLYSTPDRYHVNTPSCWRGLHVDSTNYGGMKRLR